MTAPLLPIAWPRILDDIAWCLREPDFAFPQVARPAGSRVLADHLSVSRSTLLRWQDGAEPRYCDGERLLLEWCRLTGKAAAFAPRERASLSASKMR